MSFGEPGRRHRRFSTPGLFVFAATLFVWFRTAIRENLAGMNSGQLKKVLRAGHVLVHLLRGDVLRRLLRRAVLRAQPRRALAGGEGEGGRMNYLLWEGFQFSWPMMQTPQEAVGGAAAQLIANNGTFTAPQTSMSFAQAHAWYAWLPLWNTIILLSSSVTVHIAHTGLLNGDKKVQSLARRTVALGAIFLMLQVAEYYEAYAHFGLTLNSGYLRFDLLHADRLSRFPRVHGHDHAGHPAVPLGAQRALHGGGPLRFRGVELVLALRRRGVGVPVPVCLHPVAWARVCAPFCVNRAAQVAGGKNSSRKSLAQQRIPRAGIPAQRRRRAGPHGACKSR
jgi:hypothetical protein